MTRRQAKELEELLKRSRIETGMQSQSSPNESTMPSSVDNATMAGTKRKSDDLHDVQMGTPELKRSRISKDGPPGPEGQKPETEQHAEMQVFEVEFPKTSERPKDLPETQYGDKHLSNGNTDLDNTVRPMEASATTWDEPEASRSSTPSELSDYDDDIIVNGEQQHFAQLGPFESASTLEKEQHAPVTSESQAGVSQDSDAPEDATGPPPIGESSGLAVPGPPASSTVKDGDGDNLPAISKDSSARKAAKASAKRTPASTKKGTVAGDQNGSRIETRALPGRIRKPPERFAGLGPLPDPGEDDEEDGGPGDSTPSARLRRKSSGPAKYTKPDSTTPPNFLTPTGTNRRRGLRTEDVATPGALTHEKPSACLTCNSRHLKCTRERPRCQICEKADRECVCRVEKGRKVEMIEPSRPLQGHQKSKTGKGKMSATQPVSDNQRIPQASRSLEVDMSNLDQELLELSRALTQHRNVPMADKPEPTSEPRVWADSRQALSETLPFFKKPQGGCHANDSHVYAFLFDGVGHCREHMDTGVIIARAGGSMESDSSGSMVQGKDQSMSEAQVKAVLNDMQLQNPVIIICGDKNVGSPVKMPHKYCVLGWYKPTMVWTEKTAGRAKKDYVTVKYRFERLGLDSDKAAWYEPRDRRDLPSSEHVGAMEKHTCLDCNQESARIYLEGWFCLNSECASFWKLSDESAPTGPMNYDPAFLLHRTNWETEIEPYDVRIPPPDLGKTIGSHLSYINTRGIVCPKCGRCNPRYHFRGWVCDNVNSKCDWKLDAVQQPVTQTALHQPWDTFGNGPSLARNKHEPCVSVKVTSAFGYKVYTYRVDGINGKLVHAVSNKRINGEPDGPDEMFEELQVKDMGLERRRFKVERGSGSKAKAAKTASDVLTTPTKSPSMQNDQLPTPSSELQVLIPPSIGQDAGPKSVDAVAQLQSRRMEDDAGSAFQAAVLSTDVEIDAEAQPNGATDTAHSLAACVSDEESGAWASQPIRNALGAEMTAEAGAQAAESIKSSTAQTSIPREVEMVSTRSQATAGADVISADSEDQTTSAAAASPVSEHGDVAHRTAENCAEAELSADKADKVLNSPTIGAPILERADPNPQLTTKVAADMGMIAPTDEPVEPVDPSKAGTQPDEGGVETGDFMTAFSVNYGMPYKFVAGGASRSFEDAPRAARACRSRLQWAAKNLMKDPEGNTDFNEELIFAYLEGQKIEYHDDGEEGLGPCITTLSLGGSAKMSLRMKAKYHFGCSKTGVFNQEKPIPGSVKYDQRLKAWEELQTVSDRSEYQRRLKALPKGLGIYADRNKKAGDLVNITLNHGDIVVMDGYDIQKYLEHKVAPEGFLRFALTCRTVLPNHLKPGELPPYEVREDDFGYDGSNVL